MTIKFIGAILIVTGCGGFGFSMVAYHRREEQSLNQLIRALEWMEWELSCRLTPLPQLCSGAAAAITGPTRQFLEQLSLGLEEQLFSDAALCAGQLIQQMPGLSPCLAAHLSDFAATLARFDLPGQLQGLRSVRERVSQSLRELSENRDARLRSYQTLGLCAGAALAILFL